MWRTENRADPFAVCERVNLFRLDASACDMPQAAACLESTKAVYPTFIFFDFDVRRAGRGPLKAKPFALAPTHPKMESPPGV